ncbi:hypothetical protein VTH06DRAFT_8323 [Thermothelomyces fergusii]
MHRSKRQKRTRSSHSIRKSPNRTEKSQQKARRNGLEGHEIVTPCRLSHRQEGSPEKNQPTYHRSDLTANVA